MANGVAAGLSRLPCSYSATSGLPAGRLANLERAEPVLEVDDFEVVSWFVGIGHDDQAIGPSDIEDAAVALVNRLDVVDAGGEPELDAAVRRLVCRSGSPRSPARCMVARVWPVTSCGPLNIRSSSVSSFAGSAAGSCTASAVTSASARPHGIGGILAPRAIVFSVMDVYLVPVGPDRHELYCEVPDEPDADERGGNGDRASRAACFGA